MSEELSKIQKVKNHFRENKKLYIGIAIGVGVTAIGFVTYILVNGKNGYNQTAVVLGNHNTVTQTIDVYIEALGDPGNIVQDTTTGIIYASQNQAARELGLNPSRLSQHLHGRAADVDGHIFAKLGKAMVSE